MVNDPVLVAPKAHLHSSAKDGLGVPGFPYVRVTLILGFLKIFEFFLTEMESFTHDIDATIGPVGAPWIVWETLKKKVRLRSGLVDQN